MNKHIWGGVIEPGKPFYEPIALDMHLGSRDANDGDNYTMEVDYWINITTEDGDVSANPKKNYTFTYRRTQ